MKSKGGTKRRSGSAINRKRKKQATGQPTNNNKNNNNETQDSSNNNNNNIDTSLTEQEDDLNLMSNEEKCDYIAELSESILQDPTKAFVSTEKIVKRRTLRHEKANLVDINSDKELITIRGPCPMKLLLDLANPQKLNDPTDSHAFYICQLATMSLVAIFKDIIPNYRIRLPTAAEMAGRISKDTRQLWNLERNTLSHYQMFLKLLERNTTMSHNNNDNDTSKQHHHQQQQLSPLGITSILCFCELLKAAFHFNFRSNVLKIVIRYMNHGSNEQVRTACCSAMEYIFEKDTQGQVALEASKMIAKFIKDAHASNNKTIHAQVLQTFLKLPLKVHVDEAQAAKIAQEASNKQRKKQKQDDNSDAITTMEIENELQEGNAKVNKMILARCQSETLQAVILTYFRILKHCANAAGNSNDNNNKNKSNNRTNDKTLALLPSALEGLAKFAHLINLDTVVDLLDVLKQLLSRHYQEQAQQLVVDGKIKEMDDGNNIMTLPLQAAANSVLTAFQTLNGPGRELQIDVKEYISPLYTQLVRLGTEHDTESSMESILKCCDLAFCKRTEFSTVRIAAFIKQLLTVALHVYPKNMAIPILAMTRQIMQRYKSTSEQFVLSSEADVLTSGEYNPNVSDPELSNPFSTLAWEVGTLKFHVDGLVSQQAMAVGTMKLLQLPAESPLKLFQNLTEERNALCIEFDSTMAKRGMKKHPLCLSKQKQSQINTRFVTPRKQSVTLLTMDDTKTKYDRIY